VLFRILNIANLLSLAGCPPIITNLTPGTIARGALAKDGCACAIATPAQASVIIIETAATAVRAVEHHTYTLRVMSRIARTVPSRTCIEKRVVTAETVNPVYFIKHAGLLPLF
jgi:hypothetical protein